MDHVTCGTRCPGGPYCGCEKCNDRNEFQKLLELKKGVVIYRHNERQIEDEDATERALPNLSFSRPIAAEDTSDTKDTSCGNENIVIIIHNTKDENANATDFLHELDINKVNCPRCREILKRAKAMLKNISTVKNKETIGVCDLCRLRERFRAPCQYCQRAIEKFKSFKPLITHKEDYLKNRLVSLLAKAKTNVIIMKQHEKLRAYSDIDVTDAFEGKEKFDQSLQRPKSDKTLYSKSQLMRDTCKCLWQKQIEAKKININIKTQVDLKKPALEKAKEDYYIADQTGLALLKSAEQHAPQPISAMKKTPYHFGLRSETVLGVGTTGIMRRSHSDESLITSFSDITEKMFKKNFKYFFPRDVKKQETIVKTSEELIRDTRDRFKAEIDEKLKEEEKRNLLKQKRQLEKEAALEEIKRKTEWARHERLSDIDIRKEKLSHIIKDSVIGMEKGDSYVTKKKQKKGDERKTEDKIDKKKYKPKETESTIQRVKEKERPEKQKKEKEQVPSAEKRAMLDKDKEHKTKSEKLIRETDTLKTEHNVKEKSDKIKQQGKEKDKLVKPDKISKPPDTIKTEKKTEKKEERVEKIKEQGKEKENLVKPNKISQQADKVKTPEKKDVRVDKIKERGKEKDSLVKPDIISKRPDKAKTEKTPEKKEERVDKIKDRGKEKDSPVKPDIISKRPDKVKTEKSPEKKEDTVDKIKEQGKEKDTLVKLEKNSKQPETIKTERKPKEKEERLDKVNEKQKSANTEKSSKQPDEIKSERLPKEKEEITSKEPAKAEKNKQLDTGNKEQKPKEKEEAKGKVKQEVHEKEKPDRKSKIGREPDAIKEERKDAEKPVQKAKEKSDATKGAKDIDNKKSQEKGEQISKAKGDRKDKLNLRKETDVKPPIPPPIENVREKPSGPVGKIKAPVEPKTESKGKHIENEDKTLLEKDNVSKNVKSDKKSKKSKEESTIEGKGETTGKGVLSKNEDNLIDAMLKKQDKMKLDAMKLKQSGDTKLEKNMQKADALTAKTGTKAVGTHDVRDIKQKKEEERKTETNKAEGKLGKKDAEINFKDLKILPSADDLILKLVKTSKPMKEFKSLPPVQRPPLAIIRRVRKKPSISSFRSELALDAESLLRKRMESKKIVEPEIIYGENIFLEKDIPPEPEHVKPAIFQSTFKGETNIEPEIDKIEPKPEKKPDGSGIFRYTLSDRKFIDKGWTVLPTQKVLKKVNMYRMHPAKPEFDWFERNKGKGQMMYDSGEKLAEVKDNGRGQWYYKNGRLALDYYESEDLNTQQRVVIYSSGDPDERGRSQPVTVLGMFDHLGSGVVFDHRGKIRLKYNQNEGVILDRELGPVTHWLWHSLNEPPELEQVMIETQLPYKEPGIAALGDLGDKEARSNDEEMIAIELDNFLRSRNMKPTQKFIPHQIRMKALKINNQFSLKVLDQKTIYLLFREGSNTMKLNLGMTLDDTEILDTRTAELNDVSVDIDKKPAMTDSVANLQKSLANVQRLHRLRDERELRLRPLSPSVSAARLTAGISKPLRKPLLTTPADSSGNLKCRAELRPTANNLYYNTRLI